MPKTPRVGIQIPHPLRDRLIHVTRRAAVDAGYVGQITYTSAIDACVSVAESHPELLIELLRVRQGGQTVTTGTDYSDPEDSGQKAEDRA